MIARILTISVVLLFLGCEKAVDVSGTKYENSAKVSVGFPSPNTYEITATIDTASWNVSDLNGVLLVNYYRFSGDNRTLISRKIYPNNNFTSNTKYTYRNDLGVIDTIYYDGSVVHIDPIGDRNNSAVSYGAAFQYSVQRDSARLSGGFEGKITVIDAKKAKPVNRLVINNLQSSTVTPYVVFSGYFDMEGVDTLFVYRASILSSLDSVGSWIPRIAKSKYDSLVLLKGTTDDYYDPQGEAPATAVIKRQGNKILRPYTDINGRWADTIQYGDIGRVDTVPKSLWRSYFDTLIENTDGMAYYSRRDTLLQGLGVKYILMVPSSKSSSASLWAPLYDNIKIREYVGDIAVDIDRMGSNVGV
ncbi:MAG: hypothetical protein JNL74_21750, partial [Fibrobacteres bacterium]|nr:hypothetical protein [Fibrobacterota bacterium]